MTDTEFSTTPKGRRWLEAERALNDKARLAGVGIRGGECQPNPTAKAPIQHPASSPIWSAYQVAIPTGWKALLPVFYPVQNPRAVSDLQDSLSAVNQEFWRFGAGVLLCRLEVDGQEAVQEFEDGALLAAAFLGSDGQYLQASQDRPAFGVVPLAAPSSKSPDQTECLVLLPLLESPPVAGKVYPPCRLFVDGVEVRFAKTNTPMPQSEPKGDR